MGLPVTSGGSSRSETLDGTGSRGSLFASGAVEKVGGMVRMIPPELTKNRHRVPGELGGGVGIIRTIPPTFSTAPEVNRDPREPVLTSVSLPDEPP